MFRDGSRWLLDVRPAELVKEQDATCFAAAGEAALEAGWRYSVVAGWRPHVLTGIDALSAQRRDLEDRLGLQDDLLRAVSAGPAAFGDLVAATPLPAVARAHALHLLWRRRLGTDLSRPLGDTSLVWLARGPADGRPGRAAGTIGGVGAAAGRHGVDGGGRSRLSTAGCCCSAGEEEAWRSIRWLVHHPDCQAVPDGDAGPARPAGQPPGAG